MLVEALTAVDWLFTGRLEGNLRFLAAIGAGNRVHLARTASAAAAAATAATAAG